MIVLNPDGPTRSKERNLGDIYATEVPFSGMIGQELVKFRNRIRFIYEKQAQKTLNELFFAKLVLNN